MAKDPGKTFQTAKRFPIGQTKRTLKESLDSTDRIDFWKFNTKLRSGLDLNLKGIQKSTKLDVALFNTSGQLLKSLSSRGKKSISLKDLAIEPGTFYVRVKLKQGNNTQYSLTLSAPTLSDQVGDSFETASALRSAQGTINDFVGNSDPNDFLQFGTLIAGQLNLNLTGLSDDANLEVYDGSRNLLFSSTNAGTASDSINQRLTGIAGSTYYIRVTQAPGKDTNYSLSYSFIGDTPVQTPSGLEYIDLATGTGATPTTGQTVTVNYTGILLDGTKFDSSRDRGTPFSFKIGTGRVIQGWDIGISDMRVGGRRQLIIPADLAYGSSGNGSIPPNATLIFDVEVLGIS